MSSVTKDLTKLSVAEGFRAQAVTTTAAGIIVDLQGFESALVSISVGALANADNTFAADFEHGDESDLSDAAALVAADVIGTLPTQIDSTNDLGVTTFGYKGDKRYIRIGFGAAAGTGPSAPIAVQIIRGHARHQT